jgi:hypothetical protein
MIPHPENHNQQKPDKVGDEIRNLMNQVSHEFCIADFSRLRNFEVQNKRVNTMA